MLYTGFWQELGSRATGSAPKACGSGVPSDLEGGSITNLSTQCDNESGPSQAGPGNKHPFEAALMPALSLSAKLLVLEKVPSRPWNHRSPRGAFTLLGPDSIYQISL